MEASRKFLIDFIYDNSPHICFNRARGVRGFYFLSFDTKEDFSSSIFIEDIKAFDESFTYVELPCSFRKKFKSYDPEKEILFVVEQSAPMTDRIVHWWIFNYDDELPQE